MGLDTYALRPMTLAEREAWVAENNAKGTRPVLAGLAEEELAEPLTLADAPEWTTPQEDLPWPGGLVGGMLSGDGGGPSFRGKVYAEYVEQVTGISLYEDHIEPERVKAMADDLEQDVESREWTDVPRDPWDGLPSAEEAEALARWFRVCANNDCSVSGWW